MKAVIYTEYGSPDVLKITEIEKPIPGDKELLIRVHASSVSAGAVWMRKGQFPGSIIFTIIIRLLFGILKPRRQIIGFEFSGVVEDVGKDVTLFRKGDEVYGTTTGLKNGAYADYVCVPERWKEGVVTVKPEQLTFEEAAALPVGGMTALQLLMKSRIKAGKNIMIYGASGSVGTYAVQIAKYFGATVTGVCSSDNIGLVSSIGADHVIDYTQENIFHCQDRFDIIFDAVGKLDASKIKVLLKPGGKFCSVKSPTNESIEYLELLHRMISEGKLRPVMDRMYAFQQIAEAHHYVEAGRKKGNVIILHHGKVDSV